MQAVKIQIPGDFWDSQIANGCLYLFGRSGDIRILDWDRLTDEIGVDASLKPELNWALSRNAALYRARASLGYPGADAWNLVKRKFQTLEGRKLEISAASQGKHLLSRSDNRFPFPHRDSTIHRKQLVIAGQQGLYVARTSPREHPRPVALPERLWDGSAFTVKARSKNLAVAAGDEGLYQFRAEAGAFQTFTNSRLKKLTAKNCIDCGWTFRSIYGSSFKAPGYLVRSWEPAHPLRSPVDQDLDPPPNYALIQSEPPWDDFIPEEEIFRERGYSWATRDSICQVERDTVRIVRYFPRARKRDKLLKDLGTIQIAGWKGEIVSASVAVFGIVIECEEAVVIKLSTEEVLTLPGEIVRFRIFPESPNYENQLHLIYEDRLEILAFTHDYFVDQQEKRVGYRRLSAKSSDEIMDESESDYS